MEKSLIYWTQLINFTILKMLLLHKMAFKGLEIDIYKLVF